MAATNGTLIAIGRSGRTYAVDLYIPDAVATKVCFNPAGLAASTSDTTWRVPEDITIVDIVAAATPTAVGAALNVNGAVQNGGTVRWANQLNSLSTRAKLKLGVRAGDFVGFTQF